MAARRVLPPDLMTPAKASKPFMKLSGPLAVPPPERPSVEERSGDRLVPVPDPHLKSMPSVLARVRMESSESCTELMKQAEHCGLRVAGDAEFDALRLADSSASSARRSWARCDRSRR